MACALTQNYVLDCRDSLGGLIEVYFIESSNISSTTEASGVITAISKVTGKKFYKYELTKGTSAFTETISANVANGTMFYTTELTIILNKLQANTRNEILLLGQNRLIAVAKDVNGKYWYLGKTRALDLTGGSAATGTAEGDRSGYTLTFTGAEKNLAPEVESTVALALTTAG
ncbi:hypothetical protein UFOVP19_1 [uncultured Caudovirales phage]|uniref:Uncharacterized protein n=1 Tax=uncultured Caudovirales phage TaxID=2100421 RepID=A0A6J5KNE7_9CAUD|nr:hypothetical protein UFOVP19_1 [uncultured Caudovirales phage]